MEKQRYASYEDDRAERTSVANFGGGNSLGPKDRALHHYLTLGKGYS